MRALTVSVLLALLGCARATSSRSNDVPAGGLLITEERIQNSGGRTAWEVLKRAAPMLTMQENRSGRPAHMGRRGRASIYLDDAPMIILDGVRLSDFRVLDQIPANTIFSIYVLTGIEGTTYYGTNAVSGVILIRTKDGPES